MFPEVCSVNNGNTLYSDTAHRLTLTQLQIDFQAMFCRQRLLLSLTIGVAERVLTLEFAQLKNAGVRALKSYCGNAFFDQSRWYQVESDRLSTGIHVNIAIVTLKYGVIAC